MRQRTFAILSTLTVFLASSQVLAQKPNALPAAKVSQQVSTIDGWVLPLDYYRPANSSTNTPVVILLHGADGNRLVWKDLASSLQQAGYAVVAVDLRKHGESQGPPVSARFGNRVRPIDYANMMRLDLESVKLFLLGEHQAEKLNIRKTAIVAADDMAPIAANYAVMDWLKTPYPDAATLDARTPRGQDIRALALISPSESAGPLKLTKALMALRNNAGIVAVYMAVGSEDRADNGITENTYDRLVAGMPQLEDRVILDEFDRIKVRGTELLNVRGLDLENRIVSFLNKNLKPLNDTWRTRQSRLE